MASTVAQKVKMWWPPTPIWTRNYHGGTLHHLLQSLAQFLGGNDLNKMFKNELTWSLHIFHKCLQRVGGRADGQSGSAGRRRWPESVSGRADCCSKERKTNEALFTELNGSLLGTLMWTNLTKKMTKGLFKRNHITWTV
jgi:hypothetical protein